MKTTTPFYWLFENVSLVNYDLNCDVCLLRLSSDANCSNANKSPVVVVVVVSQDQQLFDGHPF